MTKKQLIERIRENGGKGNMGMKKAELESILADMIMASIEKPEPEVKPELKRITLENEIENGSYAIIATYENHEFSGIKVIDARGVYTGFLRENEIAIYDNLETANQICLNIDMNTIMSYELKHCRIIIITKGEYNAIITPEPEPEPTPTPVNDNPRTCPTRTVNPKTESFVPFHLARILFEDRMAEIDALKTETELTLENNKILTNAIQDFMQKSGLNHYHIVFQNENLITELQNETVKYHPLLKINISIGKDIDSGLWGATYAPKDTGEDAYLILINQEISLLNKILTLAHEIYHVSEIEEVGDSVENEAERFELTGLHFAFWNQIISQEQYDIIRKKMITEYYDYDPEPEPEPVIDNQRTCPNRSNSHHDDLVPTCHRCGGIVFVDPQGDLRCSCRNLSEMDRQEQEQEQETNPVTRYEKLLDFYKACNSGKGSSYIPNEQELDEWIHQWGIDESDIPEPEGEPEKPLAGARVNSKPGLIMITKHIPCNVASTCGATFSRPEKRTLNKAIEILESGDSEKAWKIAQEDTGLLPNTTKDQWLKFAYKCLKSRQ